MPRYFIEVAYVGTRYSGFQVQLNSNTIQAEVTRALKILFHREFELTGSSRTDAGVHALQNYFHFDADIQLQQNTVYSLNALLPYDIVIKKIFEVEENAHCRFDAVSRSYFYTITRHKNPFYFERSYYYPFSVNTVKLHEAASLLMQAKDFTSFSKKNTQVNTFLCNIQFSQWILKDEIWQYEVKADRFLRGMVKGLVGTMLRLAKDNSGSDKLLKIIEAKDPAVANFAVPSAGLCLVNVEFKESLLSYSASKPSHNIRVIRYPH